MAQLQVENGDEILARFKQRAIALFRYLQLVLLRVPQLLRQCQRFGHVVETARQACDFIAAADAYALLQMTSGYRIGSARQMLQPQPDPAIEAPPQDCGDTDQRQDQYQRALPGIAAHLPVKVLCIELQPQQPKLRLPAVFV